MSAFHFTKQQPSFIKLSLSHMRDWVIADCNLPCASESALRRTEPRNRAPILRGKRGGSPINVKENALPGEDRDACLVDRAMKSAYEFVPPRVRSESERKCSPRGQEDVYSDFHCCRCCCLR